MARTSGTPNDVSEALQERHESVRSKLLPEEPYQLRIGGDWTAGTGGELVTATDATTGAPLAEYRHGSAADVDDAVTTAWQTYRGNWGSKTGAERAAALESLADRLANDDLRARLGKIGALETGTPYETLMGSLVSQTIERLRFFAGLARTADDGARRPSDSELFVYTRREPYGVVGVIPAWNIPLAFIGLKLAPALAAGNTVVLKPSPRASLSYLAVAELFDEVLPPGTVNIITGDVEAGVAISGHERIHKVTLTGSVHAGQAVLEAAANSNLKSTTLELGGKSPHIIFPDADLEQAAATASKAVFSNAGQVCTAASRLFVHESVEQEVLERLCEATDRIWTIGDPLESGTTLGPLVDKNAQQQTADFIETAREEGATVHMGGQPPDGPFGDAPYFEPTVLTDVNNDDTVACEEVFGPVLSVITWNDREDLINMANDTEYGLAAGLWTNDLETAHSMAAALEAGTVWVNCYARMVDSAPFGGYKKSGIGRENGIEALNDMRRTKTVTMELG